ncbi:MAG: hypothetical protein M3N13_06870 [Candidatus Eremiobacteraeota bacterium]|nr:hypothetical protein [Candidatus Eremiobacteraeota bacterium]
MASMLHLKSGLAYLGDEQFLAIAELVPRIELRSGAVALVPAGEEYGANCVRVNDAILLAAQHPRLAALLNERGFSPIALEMSEFEKMDGGLSCLSLRF